MKTITYDGKTYEVKQTNDYPCELCAFYATCLVTENDIREDKRPCKGLHYVNYLKEVEQCM